MPEATARSLSRQQGGRVQAEAQLRIHDREAAIGRNDLKARRPRRLREAIDGVM